MKVLTQHQCPDCKGTGIDPQLEQDWKDGKIILKVETNPNTFSSNSEAKVYALRCLKCNGAKVIEEWLELKEFAEYYLGLQIKTENQR